MGFVVRVFVQYGHAGYDEPVDDDAHGDDEHADADLHPMGKIALAGGQMPIKRDQPDIQPVDDNSQHRPGGRPFNQFYIFKQRISI